MIRKRASRSTIDGISRTRRCMSLPFGAAASIRSKNVCGKIWQKMSSFMSDPSIRFDVGGSNDTRPAIEIGRDHAREIVGAAGCRLKALLLQIVAHVGAAKNGVHF